MTNSEDLRVKMKAAKITIKMVADSAGMKYSTVSHQINGYTPMSEPVLTSIDELFKEAEKRN